jgi:transcriptional regulator with XRE-family HTH domain
MATTRTARAAAAAVQGATETLIEVDLGARIRALRIARGATLRQLAAQAGVTESFLSQVERGVAAPSIASVQRIARALGQSIAELFATDDRAGIVVRAADRRRVVYQGLGAVDEFLTRRTDGRLQVILSTIEPGGGTGEEAYSHDSDEEVVVVLEGSLDLWVGPEHYRLETGDAVTHSSRLPHRNTNPGPGVARVLFCITPPSF